MTVCRLVVGYVHELTVLPDLIFKNQAAGQKDRSGEFVNDLLRTEFHRYVSHALLRLCLTHLQQIYAKIHQVIRAKSEPFHGCTFLLAQRQRHCHLYMSHFHHVITIIISIYMSTCNSRMDGRLPSTLLRCSKARTRLTTGFSSHMHAADWTPSYSTTINYGRSSLPFDLSPSNRPTSTIFICRFHRLRYLTCTLSRLSAMFRNPPVRNSPKFDIPSASMDFLFSNSLQRTLLSLAPARIKHVRNSY